MNKNIKHLFLLTSFTLIASITTILLFNSSKNISSLEASTKTNGNCSLKFDRKTRPITKDGMMYSQDGYVRLFYTNATIPNTSKGNSILKPNGAIYTNATPYNSEKGWGSAVNVMKGIEVKFAGEINLFTAYSIKDDGVPNWTAVYNQPKTSSFYHEIFGQFPPRFFKIEAVKTTTIMEINVDCQMIFKDHVKFYNGKYSGDIKYDIMPSAVYGYDAIIKDKFISVNDREISFFKIAGSDGTLHSLTLYNGGEYKDDWGTTYSENVLYDDPDSLNPHIYRLTSKYDSSIRATKYKIELQDIEDATSFPKIDNSNSKIDKNAYTISMWVIKVE